LPAQDRNRRLYNVEILIRTPSRFNLLTSHFSNPSIIFVHGLTEDREKTWTAENAAVLWPQTLLPTEVPHARVLTFGYNAYVADWRDVISKYRIRNHSRNLLTAVATYRENDNTVNLA
jgi:protein SERAC1